MKTDKAIQRLVDSYGSWCLDECENRAGGTGRFTKGLYPYDALFSPVQVNRLTLKNRVVMAPMGNCQMSEETGRPSEKMLQYFFARAAGGAGLLTTGLIPISHGIDSSVTENDRLSYFPRIDRSRTELMGWRDLAQGVHARGSRIFIQLTPGLGRVGSPECLMNKLRLPVSASWNPNYYLPNVPCRPLTDLECSRIIRSAGQAAANAKACLLDGAYLHGHEGYLLEQLTNPAFNRRKIGRYADWQRFGIDLVQEIRRRVGPAFPIMYRIDLSLALNETYGERMNTVRSLKKFRDGRSVQDTLLYMENLVLAGVDIFDVDLGCYENWWLPHPPAGMPAGCFLEVAGVAKEYFRGRGILSNAGVAVPIVAVGKLGYPDLAERALREGKCDMVMLGRPLLADPEWCNKAYTGEVDRIRPCIGCQEGCINEFVEGGHPQCAVNPRTGFEEIIPREVPPAPVSKRIGVVGGGPAGCNFALTAARRGHRVEILERSDRIGGKLIPASLPRIKFDVKNYLDWLVKEVEAEPNITVRLHTEANGAFLREQCYDAVVFANGTRGEDPPIGGLEKVRHIRGEELLREPGLLADDAKKIVVVGGGSVGLECAWWLSYERGREVKVLEMLPHFMHGVCTANRGHLIHYLEAHGVELFNCTTVKAFGDGNVVIARNISGDVPDPYCTWTPILPENVRNPLAKRLGPEEIYESLPCDLAVLCTGGGAEDRPFFEAQREHIAQELYNIGDSFSVGRVLEATRAAFNLASVV
jgi:2-enoate reductase